MLRSFAIYAAWNVGNISPLHVRRSLGWRDLLESCSLYDLIYDYDSIAVIARSRFETCCVRLFGERVVDTFHYYLRYNLLLGNYTKLAGLDLEDRLLRSRCMSVFPTLLIALFVVSGFSASMPKTLIRLWVFSFLRVGGWENLLTIITIHLS